MRRLRLVGAECSQRSDILRLIGELSQARLGAPRQARIIIPSDFEIRVDAWTQEEEKKVPGCRRDATLPSRHHHHPMIPSLCECLKRRTMLRRERARLLAGVRYGQLPRGEFRVEASLRAAQRIMVGESGEQLRRCVDSCGHANLARVRFEPPRQEIEVAAFGTLARDC